MIENVDKAEHSSSTEISSVELATREQQRKLGVGLRLSNSRRLAAELGASMGVSWPTGRWKGPLLWLAVSEEFLALPRMHGRHGMARNENF